MKRPVIAGQINPEPLRNEILDHRRESSQELADKKIQVMDIELFMRNHIGGRQYHVFMLQIYNLSAKQVFKLHEFMFRDKIRGCDIISFFQMADAQFYALKDPLDATLRPEDRRPAYIAALLATVPEGLAYEEQSTHLVDLRHEFRQGVAGRQQRGLNEKIQTMPHETFDEKKELARWVNEELRLHDLAIKCPKTGQPSLLLAGPGNHPETGRFMFEHKTAEGKRVRPVITTQLPQLELMEANPRREALIEWRDRLGQKGGGAKRE